ncbi:hypothetical protein TGAM01_v206667 [Trichoderma gamsii]|uniref:Uncharacterized protein n=1 Tax=Trichoderma gamsii TaxID=398673 RepID=A0A2P4ZJA0_9HYPO|nr:hypothetical protein TGAM01_v206667 [Trichoderma gamsii]PON24335.1 hypothetical protein TGAM01_v206667 [Trichoderma gamsii]
MNMNRAAAAAHSEQMHGDHVLQGGHAILKEDTDPTGQDSTFSDTSHSGMKQFGLEGTKQGDFQASAGARDAFGETTRQGALRHVGQVHGRMV